MPRKGVAERMLETLAGRQMTVEQIVEEIKASRSSVDTNLKILMEEGRIKRHGRSRPYKYRVVKEKTTDVTGTASARGGLPRIFDELLGEFEGISAENASLREENLMLRERAQDAEEELREAYKSAMAFLSTKSFQSSIGDERLFGLREVMRNSFASLGAKYNEKE